MPFCPKCRDEFQNWVKECPDCKMALVERLEPKVKPAKVPPPPSPHLVTVAVFAYPTAAYIASAKLESEGIWSFVADEHIVNTYWLYSGAIGGVKLQVSEPDAKDALEILGSAGSDQDNPENSQEAGETCPNCHANNIQYQTFNTRVIYVIWLITYLLWKGFTIPLMKRKWVCKTCGYKWKDNDWFPPVHV